MNAIIEAIDRLIEANAALRKERALGKSERALAKAMDAAFRTQGRAFLKRFAKLRTRFPREIREVAEAIPWEPLFDDAELSTLQAFAKPLDEFTARSLLSGITAAIAELTVETSFTLEHPEAVEYLKRRGTERLTQINGTTRERLRLILEQAGEERPQLAAEEAGPLLVCLAEVSHGVPPATSDPTGPPGPRRAPR